MGGLLPPAWIEDGGSGALSRGRRDAPGRRRPDGSALRPAGERITPAGPRFDAEVPKGGYAWWYIDAISDDGRYGLTIIAFIGSVFSPYYVSAGKADPYDHVSLNVALYGGLKGRWAMTERGRSALRRNAQTLAIGPSSLHWDGGCLSINIAEVGAVFGEKVQGSVRVYPQALVRQSFDLDSEGRHRWAPIATRARVEADFASPGLSWRGDAYVDSNFGSEPMEDRFADWQWSRAHLKQDTAVFYEGRRLDGSRFALALRVDRSGVVRMVEAPPTASLSPTSWLMPRQTRADAGRSAHIVKTWENAPFYSRSAVKTVLFGEPAIGVHESLSLTRFRTPMMQWMLPYRMPRRA
jgi:carotenoid 1,2-hydratase